MNILSRFGLVIDPKPAQAGARAVVQAAGTIKPALANVEKAAASAAKAMATQGSAGTAAGAKIGSAMRTAERATEGAGKAAQQAANGFSGLVGKIMGVVTALGLAYAAFRAVSGAIGFVTSAIGKASQMEGFTDRWAFMLSSMDKAKAKMAELAEFANTTPFDLPGVTEAALALARLKNTGLETMKGLRMVGDAASVAKQPIEEVASRISRVINSIKAGGGGGAEAGMLADWQVFSPELFAKIKSMGTDAGNFKVLLAAITGELGKTDGMMKIASESWEGLTSTMVDSWGALKTEIGKPIMEGLKPMIKEITRLLDEMKAGAISMAPEIQRIVSYIPAAFKVLRTDGGFSLALQAGWDTLKIAMDTTWKATKVVLIGVFRAVAEYFQSVFDNFDFSTFIANFSKALKQATTGDFMLGLEEIAKKISIPHQLGLGTPADPGAATAAGSKAILDAATKAYNDAVAAAPPGQAPAPRNIIYDAGGGENGDGAILNDMPRATDTFGKSLEEAGSILGEFPKNLETEATPAMKSFSGMFGTYLDDIAKITAQVEAEKNKFLADKAIREGNPDGSLFPKAEIERNNEIQRDAMLPGTDIAYNQAQDQADSLAESLRTPEEAQTAELARITALRDAKMLAESDYQRAVAKTKDDYIGAQTAMTEKATAAIEAQKTGVQKLLDSWGNLKAGIDQAGVGILQSIETNITGAIVSMVDGTKTAGQAFADMAKGIVQSILQIITKLIVQYALYAAMGMLTGGVSTGFTGFATKALSSGVHHDGGTVGSADRSRSVAAGVFAGAARFHEGGMIASNEVPIIAEKGESVLTKDQANDIKARLTGSSKPQEQAAPAVTIMNVQNPQDIEAHLAANPQIVLNVIARQAAQVRKIIGKA